MNKGRRLFFILAALLLWILPVVLAGESWFRWKWNSLASNNPFVASRVHEELWPIPRIPENDFPNISETPRYETVSEVRENQR